MAKLTDVVWCVFRQWKDCWNTTSPQPSPRTNKSFSCASENAISWFSRDLLTLALSALAGPRKRLQGNATRSPFHPHCHCHCPPLSPLFCLRPPPPPHTHTHTHTNLPYHHRCHTTSPASLHHPDCSRPPLNKEQCVLRVDWFVIPRSSWCHPHPCYSGFFSNRMLAPSPPCVSFGCSFGCRFFVTPVSLCSLCFLCSLCLLFSVSWTSHLSAFPFTPPPPHFFFSLPLSTFFALSIIIMPALFCSFWPLIFPALYNTWLSVPRWGTDASSWQGARSPSTTLRLWRPWFAVGWSAPISLTSTCPACWRPAPTRPSASSCRSFSASAPMTRTARTTSPRWVGSSSCGQGQLSRGTDWQHLVGVTLKARDSSTDQKLLPWSFMLWVLLLISFGWGVQ